MCPTNDILTTRNIDWLGLDTALARLKATLPKDSQFSWSFEPDRLSLEVLSIPIGHRGIGTGFLALVVHTADVFGAPSVLHADPTLEPGDPDLYDLVRWYSRFGFELRDVTRDYLCVMERATKPVRDGGPDGYRGILADYDLSKSRAFMSREAFQEHIEGIAESCAISGVGRPG